MGVVFGLTETEPRGATRLVLTSYRIRPFAEIVLRLPRDIQAAARFTKGTFSFRRIEEDLKRLVAVYTATTALERVLDPKMWVVPTFVEVCGGRTGQACVCRGGIN